MYFKKKCICTEPMGSIFEAISLGTMNFDHLSNPEVHFEIDKKAGKNGQKKNLE